MSVELNVRQAEERAKDLAGFSMAEDFLALADLARRLGAAVRERHGAHIGSEGDQCANCKLLAEAERVGLLESKRPK
jgi:hypothetical protein